jgi:hypothetical protein
MATTRKVVGPLPVDLTPEVIYTVPAGVKGVIRHIHVFNPQGSAIAFSLKVNADAAGSAIFDAYPIPGVTPFDHYCYYPLDATHTLRAAASADDLIVLTIGLDEITP